MSSASDSWQSTLVPEEFLRRGSPTITTENVPACPVCGASDYSQFAVGFDYELLTCSNPWRFVQCRSCQHVWLNPRPAVAELGVVYPPTYYAYNYDTINLLARKAKEMLDRRKIAKIVGHCPKAPKSYLDVGCGDGRFLRVMEQLGVPRSGLYGLELDKRVVERLRGQGYSGVFCERAEDVGSLPEGGIDLVTMFHVIEHVDNPGTVIGRVCGWLSPGGVFALETPNLDSLDARLFRRTYWGGYHIPRHWNLFTPAAISRLLKDNGLEVLATVFQTGHSFWMYSLHHAVRYEGTSRPRAGAWFDPMKSLVGLAGFTAFDLLRGTLGSKTSAMLVICRKTS
ncbi:MAG TPA: class I SAM-dependent methyltransferase [Candidatus Acidoferrum sp.]